MEWFVSIVRDLTIVAVLCSFTELLLPEGKNQYPVRLVFGLYFLAVLLNPLVVWMGSDDLSELDFNDLLIEYDDSDYSYNSTDALVWEQAEATLAREIEQRCGARYENYTFVVEVSLGENQIEQILIVAPGADQEVESIRNDLSVTYGVNRSSIIIETEVP